jgi:hypothetical protein
LADKLGLTKQQLPAQSGFDDRTLRNREKRHAPLTPFESERLLRIEKASDQPGTFKFIVGEA